MTTPNISVQFPTPFPVGVVGAGGITVTLSAGVYTISCVPSITAALATALSAPVAGIAGQMALFTGGLTLVSAAMSGDATMSSLGAMTIGAGAVTGSKIAAATVTGSNIAAATVAGSNIAAATITGGNIAAVTVADANIVAGTLTNAKRANMPANTFKGNNTGGAAAEADLTVAQTQTALGIGGQMPGTATNDTASAGNVGELISSNVNGASPVSLVTTTAKTITSISLTAGDWDVWTTSGFTGGATTTVNSLISGISTATNTLPTTLAGDGATALQWYNGNTIFNGAGGCVIFCAGQMRVSLAGTTTYFLVHQATFAVSTASGFGTIFARRRR